MTMSSTSSSIAGRDPDSFARESSPVDLESLYIPEKKVSRSSLRENGRALLAGGVLILIFLLLAFNGASRKASAGRANERKPAVSENTSEVPVNSLTPILEIGPQPGESTASNSTSVEQVLRTASEKPRSSRPATLASVRPFPDNSWQPEPYSGQLRPSPLQSGERVPKGEKNKEAVTPEKDSMVFVSKLASITERVAPQQLSPVQLWFHLPSGTRLRARLESEISSAVKTPIVAVIEDNYESDGKVVIPAGTRATGRLLNADKSGFMEIRFDSLDLPSGAALEVDATATDLQLRPLHGHVQGKGTGKNLLVRSASGVGQLAAALVGRGNLNQPLSEDDMLRERLSNNIGQVGDEQIAAAALSQRVVVSLAAGTEIYLVVAKQSQQGVLLRESQEPQAEGIGAHNVDELRQLLQLQRELNHQELSSSSKPQ